MSAYERRPAGAASETAAKQSEASVRRRLSRADNLVRSARRSRMAGPSALVVTVPAPTFNLGRVLERRRASRQLDAILGFRGYPDIGVTYGLRSSDLRALELTRSVEASERDVLRSPAGTAVLLAAVRAWEATR